MSKLRSKKWKCGQQISPDGSICGEIATYRCNACKDYFCDECFIDHLHMTIVIEEKNIPQGNAKLSGGEEEIMRTDLLAKQILDRLKSLDKDTDKTNLIENYLDMVRRDGCKSSDLSDLLSCVEYHEAHAREPLNTLESIAISLKERRVYKEVKRRERANHLRYAKAIRSILNAR